MNISYLSAIRNYISQNRGLIDETLSRLVKIPSVRSAPEPGAPYGRHCAAALAEAEKIYRENGFETDLHQNSGYLISSYGKGKSIGIFAHADVVPTGDGWTLAEPFSADIRDGFMVGRGTGDDKAGIIISLLAAKAIRELDLPFSSRLVMFTGNNEESGMGDIKAFTKEQPMPEVSIIADAAFPVYRGEKSFMRFYAVSREKFASVVEFQGGSDAFNIVAGKAHARFDRELDWEKFDGEPDLSLYDDKRTLYAKGISAHAALPDGSKNAVQILAAALAGCEQLPECDRNIFKRISAILGNYGEGLNIEGNSEIFGKTTSATGIAKMRDNRAVVSFDVRFAPEFDSAEMLGKIRRRLDELGFDLELVENDRGFFIGDDDESLRRLLAAYGECTGNPAPKPQINAGATYARYLKNAFGIGSYCWHNPPFGLPAGHGGCHQPDEYVSLDGIADAAAILTFMLLRLDGRLAE